MKHDWRFQAAENAAEQLIKRLGITTLPIDPFEIASQHNIKITEKQSNSAGVSGFLMKVGDCFGIMYATHIKNEGFIRFTISHELGHYFLPGHMDHIFSNKDFHESRSGFSSSDHYELEADHFAAGLLMPTSLFVDALDNVDAGFEAIESLKDTCKTSITATAIRFAKCSSDAVAVIVSEGNTVDYCFMSETLKDFDSLKWLRKGDRLPIGSATRDFNSKKSNITDAKKVEAYSSLNEWFDKAPEIEMKEDVVGLGTYGKTLTVLFSEDPIDDYE